jgi:predicted esterase
MNTTRMISFLVTLSLVLCFSPLTAQPEKKPDAGAEAPEKEPEATPAPTNSVTLAPKEIDKLAKLLGEYEELLTSANSSGKPQTVRKAQKAKQQLMEYLETIRKSEREPLKAVTSWWSVFSSERYNRFPGRSGRLMNQKMVWNWMGKARKVVYHLVVPSTYRSKTPGSVVLCLHPRVKKFDGEQYVRQFWAEKDLSSGPIVLAPDFPDDAEKDVRWSDRKMLYASMGVLGMEVIRDYNIDWNGLFLDGYQEGGTEAWRLASQLADNFAGVIIRGALPPDDIRFEDFVNTPFLLVGVPDAELDPDKARALAKKMKAVGVDVTVAELSEAPKPRRERDAFKEINAVLVEFLKKTRNPYPARINWSVKENNTRRCFYVRSKGEVEAEAGSDLREKLRDKLRERKADAAGGEKKADDAGGEKKADDAGGEKKADDAGGEKKADDAAKVEPKDVLPPTFQVTVDRENNKLKIQCHRIQGFQVFLNDLILDLDKDVTFEVNGKIVFNGRPERSFAEMLDQVTGSGDWTRVFPWSHNIKIDLPASKPSPDVDAKQEKAEEPGPADSPPRKK